MCPISYEIMKDPVVANDGYTYDRCSIEEWWLKSNLSPMTGLPTDSKALIPNHTLKSAIVSWSRSDGVVMNTRSKHRQIYFEVQVDLCLTLKGVSLIY